MTCKEIGEIKRSGLGVGELLKHLAGCEKFVAMSTGQSLSPKTSRHAIDTTTRTAVSIGNDNFFIIGMALIERLLELLCNPLGTIV